MFIKGARELYIEEGSSLTLTCEVHAEGALPQVVYWYHGNTLIDYNSPRGGVDLQVRVTSLQDIKLVVSNFTQTRIGGWKFSKDNELDGPKNCIFSNKKINKPLLVF